MNFEEYVESDKHNKLVERFNATFEKVKQDKKTLEKIQDRNLLEIIFSNNTRDLAKVGITQNELMFELHKNFQELLLLQKNDQKKFSEIWEQLDAINTKNNDNLYKLWTQMVDSMKKMDWQSQILNSTKKYVNNHGVRIASGEQLKKICLDIRAIAQKRDRTSIAKFLLICKSLKKFFKDFSLTNNDKREIKLTVVESKLESVNVSAEALNQHQKVIAEYFSDLKNVRKNNLTNWGCFLFKEQKLEEEKVFKMSELVSDVLDTVVIQEGDRYKNFRDELVGLLDEFINKKIDVDGEHAPELERIRRRLHENQFEIALVGEFQGGKSTTFNMLCEGREISPRALNGGGIKTSAAVVTVQNIDGNETKNELCEWAEVTWLDTCEIKRRIADVLKEYGQENLSIKPEDTPEKILRELLEVAWSKEPQGDVLDRLRVATLQFKALADTQLNEYVSQTIMPVDEFQKLVVFPIDWETKWEKQLNADFSLEESLFSIVDRVLVRIHSDALARLGCSITDCPGLFVSQWDTEKAMEVMNNANAIWYLLNGEKQIGKNDLRALNKIKDREWEDKCFFSINQKRNKEMTIRIRNTNVPILKSNGFIPEQVYIYDAFIAFRCAQLILSKQGLSNRDLEYLCLESNKIISNDICEKTIKKMLVKHLATIDEDELCDILLDADNVIPEHVSMLCSKSGKYDILSAIEKSIITQKARSILIKEGAERCQKVLVHIIAALKNQEVAAKLTLDEAHKKAENAKAKLEKFVKKWQEKFSFMEQSLIDDSLALDFFQEYDFEIKNTIQKKAINICKDEWHGSFIDADDVNKAVETKIQEEFASLIKSKLEVYKGNIESKVKFQDVFYTKFTACLDEMKEEFSELKSGEILFESINTAVKDDFSFSFTSFNKKISDKIDVPWYSWEFLKDFFTLWLRRFFQTPDDRIEAFFQDEDPVGRAYDAFKGSTEHEKQIAAYLGTIREGYIAGLNKNFKEMKSRLQSNIDVTMKTVRASNKECEQIALEAENTRKNIVEPYTEKIKDFTSKVERIYAE